jgi:hypothetical protein
MRLASLTRISEQGGRNLHRAPPLHLAQALLQIKFQPTEHQAPDHDKDDQKHTGIPGNQTKSDGLRIHVSGDLLMV